MGILELARRHNALLTTSEAIGFAQPITFTTIDGLTTATINGISVVHHHGYDADGMEISAKMASLSFNEKVLVDAGYPIRNVHGVVSLEGHRISTTDSTGSVREYVVRVRKPDSMLGCIVLELTDFKS
jgi:hypothetical protein